MVLLRVLPSAANCRGVPRGRRGQLSFPHTRSLPLLKTLHTRQHLGNKQRRVNGGGKLEAHPQLALHENDDVIAKSHPAVGTPRTSPQILYRGSAGATTARHP